MLRCVVALVESSKEVLAQYGLGCVLLLLPPKGRIPEGCVCKFDVRAYACLSVSHGWAYYIF